MRENEEVTKAIQNYSSIVIGVSGGPDSMYLLTQLVKSKSLNSLKIIVAHVNHNTRKECEKEATFVQTYCLQHHLFFELLEINEYQKKHFTEEEARKKRINFFLEVAKKYQAKAVLTAHHADDLIETMLMKIIRGSTLDGIIGLKKQTKIKDVVFLRPLLNMSKQEIIDSLEKEKIPYCMDETNFSSKHLRNRLRKNILPKLKEEDPNIHLKFLKFSQELTDITEYLQKILSQIKQEIKKEGATNRFEFLKLDEFLQKEYIKMELKDKYQENITKINPNHIKKILDFLKNPNNKTKLELPKNRFIMLNNNRFSIEKKEKYPTYCIECKNELILPNGGRLKKMDTYTEKSNNEIHLNSKRIHLPLYVTNRKPGMKMQVKNLNGTKKVKKILIDEKIPMTEKEKIPVMVDAEGKVIWLLGIKKSQYDLDKQENYDIIYKYERKESKYEKK